MAMAAGYDTEKVSFLPWPPPCSCCSPAATPTSKGQGRVGRKGGG